MPTPPPPLPPHIPMPIPPPPTSPSLFTMVNIVKMLVFKGQGSKYPDQFWFVEEDVWKAQQVSDDDIKKSQLVTMLQDRALTWYIKYSITNLNSTLAETNIALNTKITSSICY